MKLEYIEYVANIEKYHSINKAAKEMFFSQPFLSGVLKSLEDELGYALFVRNNRGVELTEEGKEFLRLGRQVQQLVFQMEQIGSKGKKQVLKICYVQSYHILDMLQKFRENDLNKIQLETRETNNPNVFFSVLQNPEYIGIAYRYGTSEDKWMKFCEDNELTFLEFYREPVHAVVGKNNPLYSREVLTYDDLSEYEAVMQKSWTEDNTYEIVMPDFMRRHFKLSRHTFDDSRSKLYFLSQNPEYFGVSVKWLDEGDPLLDIGAVHYIPILDDAIDRRMGVVFNNLGSQEKSAQRLIQFLNQKSI